MESCNDRDLDRALQLWQESGGVEERLYQGTTEQITGKLSALIERQKYLYDRQMTMREQRNKENEINLENECKSIAEQDSNLRKRLNMEREVRQKILDVGQPIQCSKFKHADIIFVLATRYGVEQGRDEGWIFDL